MNQTYEWLYDHYAEPILRELGDYDHAPIQRLLTPLPLDQPQRLALEDGVNALHLRWATNSFALGLQMGVRLLSNPSVPTPVTPGEFIQ